MTDTNPDLREAIAEAAQGEIVALREQLAAAETEIEQLRELYRVGLSKRAELRAMEQRARNVRAGKAFLAEVDMRFVADHILGEGST